ncbi:MULTISPECIES: hypothetical protein [unclassified Crossiella]|uniref:hypothetical protein n=1 Tax=unclassified Crossiella TaxID=2620835 RepID=UPI00207CED02|nr:MULTISPECIES: hypothetical protein [unclassified Crossiella]MCO1582581.1 hypothetical protein [Crossiella sp. SN42]WHT21216.1 hypothetical protein N8J89_09215 [Crossiella sp. CA-258035]
MAYRWRYEDSAGSAVDGPALEFADQDEAEAWFSAEWAELAEAGIEQVRLFDGEDEVYGPMSLRPAD